MQSELQSKRLILIQSDVSHASDLFAFWTDPEVSKFMNMEPISTVDEVIDRIEFYEPISSNEPIHSLHHFFKRIQSNNR